MSIHRPAKTVKFERSPMTYLVSDECPLLDGKTRVSHEKPCAVGARVQVDGPEGPTERVAKLGQCPHFDGMADEVNGQQIAKCKCITPGAGDTLVFGNVTVGHVKKDIQPER